MNGVPGMVDSGLLVVGFITMVYTVFIISASSIMFPSSVIAIENGECRLASLAKPWQTSLLITMVNSGFICISATSSVPPLLKPIYM